MKSKLKKVLPLLLLLMVPLSIYAATQWQGSQNVTNIKSNLALIQTKIDDLKSDAGNKDQTIREIEILLEQETGLRERRERELVDKQTEIENKIAEIQEKNNRIDELNQQVNEWKQKAGQVDGLLAQVEQLKNEKALLTTDNANLKAQLQQALVDVQEIEAITDGMVN